MAKKPGERQTRGAHVMAFWVPEALQVFAVGLHGMHDRPPSCALLREEGVRFIVALAGAADGLDVLLLRVAVVDPY